MASADLPPSGVRVGMPHDRLPRENLNGLPGAVPLGLAGIEDRIRSELLDRPGHRGELRSAQFEAPEGAAVERLHLEETPRFYPVVLDETGDDARREVRKRLFSLGALAPEQGAD